MQLSSSLTLLAASMLVGSTVTSPIGPSMWIMGDHGLSIYSPDGANKLKSIAAEDVCHNVSSYRGEGFEVACSWWDAASDGEKYVWASVSRGASVIDVFDIDSGDLVATLPTCNSPLRLNFHENRREMHVQCIHPETEEVTADGHIDTFSTSSLGSSAGAIKLLDNSTLRGYGHTAFPPDLGDSGYATVWISNKLYQINLNNRQEVAEFELPDNAYGGYDMAYSPVNQHLFIRSYVCCSCGFPGADFEDCGRYTPENITVTTGPNASPDLQEGRCGSFCQGSSADNIGVFEFDTQTDTFVGKHTSKMGFTPVPHASANGKYIVLIGGDPLNETTPSQNIRILAPGQKGAASTFVTDIDPGTNSDIDEVIFVTDDILALAPTEENAIIFVNVVTGEVSKIVYDSGENTGNSRGRSIEHALGTNYLWVSARGPEELADQGAYVLKLDPSNLSNTKMLRHIRGEGPSKLLFVENKRHKEIAEFIALQQQQTTEGSESSNDHDHNSGSVSSAQNQERTSGDDGGNDNLTIAALVVGCAALAAGLAGIVMAKGTQNSLLTKENSKPLNPKTDESEVTSFGVGVPESVNANEIESVA